MAQSKDPGPDDDKPVGRVRHDPSGRAVWEWAAQTGKQALDSTSRLLKRLELPGLTLEGDDKKKPDNAPFATPDKTTDSKPAHRPVGSGSGFNPYDNRMSVKKQPARSGTVPTKPASTPIQIARKKPGFIARLFGDRH
jgi:hypothetical protein